VGTLLCTLAQLFVYACFGRIIFSWIRVTPGTPLASVASALHSVTEPVLGPLRRVIPPVRMGAAALDLSPLIVLIGVPYLMAQFGC
jgi:YggT family protein